MQHKKLYGALFPCNAGFDRNNAFAFDTCIFIVRPSSQEFAKVQDFVNKNRETLYLDDDVFAQFYSTPDYIFPFELVAEHKFEYCHLGPLKP